MAADRLQATRLRVRLEAFGALAAVVVAIAVTVAATVGSGGEPGRIAAHLSGSPRCCWIVKAGQTLLSIAKQESVGLADIEDANPRLAPSRLLPGQRVRIPG